MSVDTYTETTKIDKLLKKPTSHFQLSTTQLYNKILDNNEGALTELGAVNASTGKYTGRSPKDKFLSLNLHIEITLIGEKLINLSMKKLS